MKVNFFATLRMVTGIKTVDIPLADGSTIRQVLDEMVRIYPALKKELYDEQNELFRHVHLFVNERDATFLGQGLDAPLSGKDTLDVFPAIGGG